MAIDKALYQAPQGLDQLGEGEEPLEIRIEDPEAIDIEGPDFAMHMEKADQNEEGFDDNLAEYMDEGELLKIASELISDYEADVGSRKEWIQTYTDGLELLGLKIEERIEPWPGACGVFHPLLAEALVKFQAETMMETFPAAGPVKTAIIGKETPQKKEAAERVHDDMNYEITEVMKEYRPEHERMLWGLGLSGNAFKKVYEDPDLDRQTSVYVPAEDVVVPYGASDLDSAERITHVMRKTENEMKRLMHSGFYRDINLGEPSNVLDEVEKKIAEKLGFRAETDNRYKLLEIQVEWDLPGFEHVDDKGEPTGLALPYIITIDKGTTNVLSVRRNWKKGDKLLKKRRHFVHYPYIPGFGFYAFGLIHLIGAFAKSGTSILRQLVDAGTLSNLPGGFKTRGLRTKGDDTPIAPGEFRDVDVPSGTMRDNIMPLPYKEPSQVLFTLFNSIIEEGRKFAGAADLQVSDMSAASPVGTTLAILERTLKAMSAVQARIHYSMRQEFELLKDIIAENCTDEYDYDPDSGNRRAKRQDYEMVNIIPVSDPNAATMAQKVVQYQAALQLAQTAPQIYDLPLLHRQMLEVIGIKNYQKLVPIEDDIKPRDPVSENQDILRNKPVKAFSYQDHKAHIAVHMSAMQDPHIQQIIGQNPQLAQQLMAAMSAHVTEHLGMEYRKELEQTMGQTLPPYNEDSDADEEMSPEMEVKVSQMAAQAAQKLLQQHQQEAKQQQNQQQAQDPLIQLQQQELQIKQQDLQRKAQKDQSDAQLKAQQLQIEAQRIQATQQTDGAKLAIQAATVHQQAQHQKEVEGFKTSVDIQKHMTMLQNQAEMSRNQTHAQMVNAQIQAETGRLQAEKQAETAKMQAEKQSQMVQKQQNNAKKGIK
jgi:hypothetical protein